MATILDTNDIQQAKNAVNTYQTTCVGLHQQLTGIINDLRKTYFIGDASNGFDAFYQAVLPALSSNLCGDSNSVTAMLNQLLDAVEKALLQTVDPQLDQANRSAANGQSTPNADQN